MELLRSMSNCRLLQVIGGKWDVETLKSLCNIYVRPIQKSISVEIDTVESKNQIQEMCQNCLKNISVVDLRSHLEECKAESVNDEQSEADIEYVIPMDAHEETEDNIIIQTVMNLTDLVDESIDDREIDLHSETVDMHQQVIRNEPVFTERVDIPEETFSIPEAVEETVQLCEQNNISNPVEILRLYQKKVVTGRKLDIDDETSMHVGSTNFILVNRYECLRSSMEEIRTIDDPRICLEVQFYGVSAVDLEGPRKEFFCIVLQKIQQEYFSPVKEWSGDYEVIGKIMALSTLQNGKLPRILSADLIEEVFNSDTPRQFVKDLRSGLDSLGLFQLASRLPVFVHLFTPQTVPLTFRMLSTLLKPNFSVEGSNHRSAENTAYQQFNKYLREAAAERRQGVSLSNVLRFVTGAEEEPVLGFAIQPSLHFVPVGPGPFLPSANTCSNRLNLHVATNEFPLPPSEELFKFFDLAFLNAFLDMRSKVIKMYTF